MKHLSARFLSLLMLFLLRSGKPHMKSNTKQMSCEIVFVPRHFKKTTNVFFCPEKLKNNCWIQYTFSLQWGCWVGSSVFNYLFFIGMCFCFHCISLHVQLLSPGMCCRISCRGYLYEHEISTGHLLLHLDHLCIHIHWVEGRKQWMVNCIQYIVKPLGLVLLLKLTLGSKMISEF